MPRRDLFIWFGWRLLVLGQCQQQSSLSVGQLENDWLTDKYSLVIGLSGVFAWLRYCVKSVTWSVAINLLVFCSRGGFRVLIPVWS